MSNLGSFVGTATAGTVLIFGLTSPHRAYGLAMVALAVIGIGRFVVSILLP